MHPIANASSQPPKRQFASQEPCSLDAHAHKSRRHSLRHGGTSEVPELDAPPQNFLLKGINNLLESGHPLESPQLSVGGAGTRLNACWPDEHGASHGRPMRPVAGRGTGAARLILENSYFVDRTNKAMTRTRWRTDNATSGVTTPVPKYRRRLGTPATWPKGCRLTQRCDQRRQSDPNPRGWLAQKPVDSHMIREDRDSYQETPDRATIHSPEVICDHATAATENSVAHELEQAMEIM